MGHSEQLLGTRTELQAVVLNSNCTERVSLLFTYVSQTKTV
jgi:hypothetical protein